MKIYKMLIVKSFVVPRGFEPRHTESKSVVLPLYYGTKVCKSKGIIYIFKTSKDDFVKHLFFCKIIQKLNADSKRTFKDDFYF